MVNFRQFTFKCIIYFSNFFVFEVLFDVQCCIKCLKMCTTFENRKRRQSYKNSPK